MYWKPLEGDVHWPCSLGLQPTWVLCPTTYTRPPPPPYSSVAGFGSQRIINAIKVSEKEDIFSYSVAMISVQSELELIQLLVG